MKTSVIIYTSFLICSGLLANEPLDNSSELSWVDEQVEAIKPPRKGIKNSVIGSLQSPFIFLKVEDKNKKHEQSRSVVPVKVVKKDITSNVEKPIEKDETKKKLYLEAIINNSALIDGKWYKEGESVYSYTLTKVNSNNILLKQNDKTIMLTTKSNHRGLKFNNN